MNLLSSLGITLLSRSGKGIDRSAYDEYYARYERIKEYVDAIPEIKLNISDVFRHEYTNQVLQRNVMLLGRGATHSIYSIYPGSIPDGENKISLALRVRRITDSDKRVHKLRCDSGLINFQLFSELNSFSEAFARNMNPPYFTGLVQWKGPDQYSDGIIGFITEDVTKRKSLQNRKKVEAFEDYMHVQGLDGTVKHFFIGSIMPRGYDSRILRYEENPVIVDCADHHPKYAYHNDY